MNQEMKSKMWYHLSSAPVPSDGGSAPDGTLVTVCVTDITSAENLVRK